MIYTLNEDLIVFIYKYPVYYNWMIFNNLKNNLYAILISYGVYNHPTLSPHRQPRFILSEFINIIANIDIITLTRSTFSDQLENILQPIQERLLIRIQINFSSVYNFDSFYRNIQRLLLLNYTPALTTMIR